MSSGFVFGASQAPQQPQPQQQQQPQQTQQQTQQQQQQTQQQQPQQPPQQASSSSLGGLGGLPPSSGGPRMSTLALGKDPSTSTGWSTRNENRAIEELPVPPEILTVVGELKTHMKNHKNMMAELNRASEIDLGSVVEQIDNVRSGVASLNNMMHKQELLSASLVTDMKELGRAMDLLATARDVPGYGHGGPPMLLNFLHELVDKYEKRMMGYKLEIERAEFSLQTIVGAHSINAKDLWASLTATKDNIAVLAAQIQQLNENLRNALTIHKSVSQVLYGAQPKPWLSTAFSGSDEAEAAPPLDKVLSNSTMSKP